MTLVVPLALLAVAIAVMVVFGILAARRAHQEVPAAAAGPRILVHDINDDRCTGCDACVAVCPTNVLDLIGNKSRVLRFHDCIQCEACMWACPTEALVMFPEGTTPPPLKVPQIDDNFQTAIPGQYLIGEVAGKPLVKNAANLGRAAVEHMLATGLRPGRVVGGAGGGGSVDVAIVGSGPGGLAAALSCIQRGLSYVVLEKEQQIASTIARYPKGKLVMAEPYDVTNLSLLPVFDASKEQLIPIWAELISRLEVKIKLGESVEAVTRQDAVFTVKTTVASYRAQRVVLAIGTRGKPRTLQVPGENLAKVHGLLEDPDEWRGESVLVVGGGDSAVEAALALADAGAKVIISYRGTSFSRCQVKNKQAIEAAAAEGRLKAKLGSQILGFEAASVMIALADGSQKTYPNDVAFILIGADPPIAWLEKLGVHFVEQPHQYRLGKTDEVLQRLVPRAVACPQDAARAAAQVLGGAIEIQPAQVVGAATQPTPPRPRTWLRAATEALFSSKGRDGVVEGSSGSQAAIRPARKATSGDGRRDDLSAGERTRILRSLRDEGARLADEDSQVFIGVAPRPSTAFDLDFEDSPIPAPLPSASPVRLRRAGPMFADQPTRQVSVDPRLLRYDDPSPPTDPMLRGPQQEAQSDPTITDPALRAAARSHAADMRDDDFEEEQATTLGPGGRTPAAGHGRGDRTQVDGMVDVDWDLEE